MCCPAAMVALMVSLVGGYQQASFYANITLADLDRRLVRMIERPQKGRGDDLMDGSFWYYSQLEDMEKAFLDGRPGGLDAIVEYVTAGLPKFVSTPVNKTEFKREFLWDKGDFLEFGVNVEGTKWIWDKFQDILAKAREGKTTLFVQLSYVYANFLDPSGGTINKFEWPVGRPVEPQETLRVQLLTRTRYLADRQVGAYTLVLQRLVQDGRVVVTDTLVDQTNRPLPVTVEFGGHSVFQATLEFEAKYCVPGVSGI